MPLPYEIGDLGGIFKAMREIADKEPEILSKRERFKPSEVDVKLPSTKIDIKGGESREASEFKNLSRNIFSKESEYRKLMQDLENQQRNVTLDVRQEQDMANLRKKREDMFLQRRLSLMGASNVPTGGDILFQSLMGGIGTGVGQYMQNQQYEQLYPDLINQYQGFPNAPQGQPPRNQFQGFT